MYVYIFVEYLSFFSCLKCKTNIEKRNVKHDRLEQNKFQSHIKLSTPTDIHRIRLA